MRLRRRFEIWGRGIGVFGGVQGVVMVWAGLGMRVKLAAGVYGLRNSGRDGAGAGFQSCPGADSGCWGLG